jgi:hypothetical protein
MFTNTKIALAAVLVLGTASVALAGGADNTDDRGGFVMPGSMVGVNPAYHPDIFGNTAKVGKGGYAYGYVASPSQRKDLSRK